MCRATWKWSSLVVGLVGAGLPLLVWAAPAKKAVPQKPAAAVQAQPAKPTPPKADNTLLTRQLLFGNPDRASLKLSPDGKQLSFLAPVEGVLNIWVGPADDVTKAQPITADKNRGVRQYWWAYNNTHVLYLQDKDGDENWHVHSVEVTTRKDQDLTPMEKVAARLQALSPKFPDEVLVGINDRDPQMHDLHRVNIKTGAKKLVFKNEAGFLSFVADRGLNVKLATRMLPDGSAVVMNPLAKPKGKDKEPEPYLTIPFEDSETTHVLGVDATGKILFMMDSRGRNSAALMQLDFATRKPTLLVEDPKADVNNVLTHPVTDMVQAAETTYLRKQWHVVDKSIQPDMDVLAKVVDGDLHVLDRTVDDKRWVVAYVVADGPVRYYLYERASKKATFLFTNMAALENVPLARMHPVVIKARDGLDLVSYLSLPRASDPEGKGRPAKPLAMVLLVHGGPWARDSWGYNPMHQWLVNRGYAVLSVNFRGSWGFGKGFLNAGNKEWAGKMHDDLMDAVKWAVDEKIADANKVAIMGGSYGGYATLVGLTFTPDQFACGVDIVGPSNLQTLIETVPPYWAPMLSTFTARVGDHRTEEGRKLLAERSPLYKADRIKKPLLIGQGANDPRVKQAESDQIIKAMQEKKIPVTYVLYSDEGHGFARPPNRTSFYAVSEIFLAQCLGGPYQPIGDDFVGSSIAVPNGVEQIHGLAEALKK